MAKFILSAFADEAANDLSEQLRISGENGIKFIEMRGVNGKPIVDHSFEEAKEVKRILDDSGFRVSAIGSPFGKISIKDDFEQHLERYKHGVEIAHILETKFMRLFSFYIDKEDNPDDYCGEVLYRLEQFIDNANGIIPAHENEKGIYGDTAQRCLQLYENFGGKLRLVFDPANFVQCGVDTLKAYELLEGRIEYMHIKDAIMEDGKVVPAGSGDGNLKELINRFSHEAGERFLSIEPHLKVFSGFDSLEKDSTGLKTEFVYRTNEEAFTAAASALKACLRYV